MRPLARLTLTLGLLLAGTAAAQGLGGSGPLRIQADQAELDNARGISTYTGNVELTREGVRVTGDRMVVYTDENRELERIVITGDPATYYDERQGEAVPVEAEAPRMEYYASGPERIRLLEGARLWQGENRFEGETIVYEPGSDRIIADSAGSGERIDVLLFPEAGDGEAAGQ